MLFRSAVINFGAALVGEGEGAAIEFTGYKNAKEVIRIKLSETLENLMLNSNSSNL